MEAPVQGEAPKMFKIADATENVKFFKVSKDAMIAAVLLGNDEIHIYRLFDVKGEFLGERKPLAPVNRIRIKDPEFSNVIDMQIHKRASDGGNPSQADYYLYVVASTGILMFAAADKREECRLVNDDWGQLTLTPFCTDMNS